MRDARLHHKLLERCSKDEVQSACLTFLIDVQVGTPTQQQSNLANSTLTFSGVKREQIPVPSQVCKI